MASRFWVTLASNASMDQFPDNTAAHFTTKLSQHLDLIGDWQVGPIEPMYPSNVYTSMTTRFIVG